jgi:S1-C subfamily serine protease
MAKFGFQSGDVGFQIGWRVLYLIHDGWPNEAFSLDRARAFIHGYGRSCSLSCDPVVLPASGADREDVGERDLQTGLLRQRRETIMIRFNCPKCSKLIVLRDKYAGRKGACTCGAPFKVPDSGSKSSTPEPAKSHVVASVDHVSTSAQPHLSASERMTRNEKLILWGGLGLGIMVVAPLLLYVLIFRGKWENDHAQVLLDLKAEGALLVDSGKVREGYGKYEELFRLLGDHKIRNDSLRGQLDEARVAKEKAYARVTPLLEQERAADRQRQEDALRRAREKEEAARNLSPEQIVARSEKSVALIKTARGSGTGFLVAPGLLATNHHVVRDALVDQIKVYFPGVDKKESIPISQVVYEDAVKDLAVVVVSSKLPPLTLAEESAFRRGQSVTVIGNPGAGENLILENAVSVGVMSTQVKIRGLDFYQLSIGINPGNSGGPVFDAAGAVIGVVTLKATKQENIAFCVTLGDLRSAVAEAQKQSQDGAAKLRAFHDLEVVYRRTARIGQVYGIAMDGYVTFMGAAIEARLSASDGIRVASEKLDGPVADANSTLITDDIKAALRSASADPRIPESTRSKLVDLWTNYTEMKAYIDTPRGSYDSYRAKARQLQDDQRRLAESLRLILGIDDTDE